MLIKKRNFVLYAFLMIGLLLTINNQSKAQENNLLFQNRLKSTLGNFNNVRFSSLDYYELNDKQVRNLKEIIKKKLDIEEDVVDDNLGPNNQSGIDSTRINLLVSEIKKLIAKGRRSMPAIRKAFNGDDDEFDYLEDLNAQENELQLSYRLANSAGRPKTDIYRMYIITTKSDNPHYDVPEIISLVLCKQKIDKSEYEEVLIKFYNEALGNSLANEKNIITYPELVNFIIEDDNDDTKSTNLYDKLVTEFRQGNFIPITGEVRGIGTELKFMNNYGKTKSVISNENNITTSDIQHFTRISEGQPFDYLKENEIQVSLDYISYRKFQVDY